MVKSPNYVNFISHLEPEFSNSGENVGGAGYDAVHRTTRKGFQNLVYTIPQDIMNQPDWQQLSVLVLDVL